jgi:hydroxyethylthiazole kinase-like uncharacterized protein yjeF
MIKISFSQEAPMIKVLTVEQIRQADTYTIENEPVLSIDLMERAATGCYQWIKENLLTNQPIAVFCGQGNNGGDGLVIARLLAEQGFTVDVFCVDHSKSPSGDFSTNLSRIQKQNKAIIHFLNETSSGFDLKSGTLVIDALLGSGITKPVQGFLSEIIHKVNDSKCLVVAIDVPSGLFCNQPSDPSAGAIIQASYTLTFEVPRLALFWPENEPFVGEWFIIPIGLHKDFIEKAESKHFLIDKGDVATILKPRRKFAHKGTFGHGLLLSGSYGKMGAAILGARAALRAGAGLITVRVPVKGYPIIQTAVPEAMASIDDSEEILSSLPDISSFNAVAIGPGIGVHPQTASTFKLLIQNSKRPLLIDADAINILAENKTWLPFLPPQSILTPHFKEFERLTGKAGNSFERNKLQIEFSIRYGVYVILKGADTCISFPDGDCYFNPTGNPGMATGGSGDVLTGIILGLLTQGYSSAESVLLGGYLHGLAGDIASAKKSQNSMIASDIVENLPDAFSHFM